MDFLIFDIPPGPPLIPSCYIVNAFKGLTLPLGVILMIYYQNFSTRAVLITALHGSYGLLWCLKSLVAPDELWYRKATFLSAVGSATLLGLYWSPDFLIISGRDLQPRERADDEPFRIFTAVLLYVFGVVLMMASDTQKYFVLKMRREWEKPHLIREKYMNAFLSGDRTLTNGCTASSSTQSCKRTSKPKAKEIQGKSFLIDDGWFAHIRNTNYLGEILLYSSFALLSHSILPWVVYGSIWSTVFVSRWVAKDLSFMRKPGGKEYIARTSMILPTTLLSLPRVAQNVKKEI